MFQGTQEGFIHPPSPWSPPPIIRPPPPSPVSVAIHRFLDSVAIHPPASIHTTSTHQHPVLRACWLCALTWSSEPRNTQDGWDRGRGWQAVWPLRASTISPSPTSTSLTAARPMPLAHHLEEGSLVGLPGTCSLLGGRACLFQVCCPPWWLVWLLWLSAGSG